MLLLLLLLLLAVQLCVDFMFVSVALVLSFLELFLCLLVRCLFCGSVRFVCTLNTLLGHFSESRGIIYLVGG